MLVGEAVFDSYVDKIVACISAVPIEYHISNIYVGKASIFSSFSEAEIFLTSDGGDATERDLERLIKYEAIYSDGNIFERTNLCTSEAIELHDSVGVVSKHFSQYLSEKRNRH